MFNSNLDKLLYSVPLLPDSLVLCEGMALLPSLSCDYPIAPLKFIPYKTVYRPCKQTGERKYPFFEQNFRVSSLLCYVVKVVLGLQ